jgi:hypothetical protein
MQIDNPQAVDSIGHDGSRGRRTGCCPPHLDDIVEIVERDVCERDGAREQTLRVSGRRTLAPRHVSRATRNHSTKATLSTILLE